MDQNDKATAARLSAQDDDASKQSGKSKSKQAASKSDAPQDSKQDSNQDDKQKQKSKQESQGTGKRSRSRKKGRHPNNVRKIRIERMMSKAELSRRANLSVLTIDRVEKGFGCRMDTKRKILEALGLSLADRVRVFGEEE